MSEDGFKEHCRTCAAIEWCKRKFGKYWIDKSSGGVGCTHPLTAYLGTNRAEMPKPPPAPAAAPALKLVSAPAKRKISARQGTLL